MPEPNCACAAGCNAVASPMASAVRSSVFIALSFRLRLVSWCSHSDTALLLCSKNLFLDLCKTVGLWFAPCVSFFFLRFEGRHLLGCQLFSGQHSCGIGGLIKAVLGIGRVFSVVLILQLLHFLSFALTAHKGESR